MVKIELNNLTDQSKSQTRGIRGKYYAIQNSICEGKDDIGSAKSEKFKEIMKEIESSHDEVKKPREQIADAEALLDLAKTLVSSFRSLSADAITPNVFISSLLGVFGSRSPKGHSWNATDTLRWKELGRSVSPIFRNGKGFTTMIGPMNHEVKQRKYTRKPRTNLYLCAHPTELDDNAGEITETGKNISTMFQILRRKKRVKLENLVLNRKSFAQSIENLFALSFLVKDGRVAIDVEENGSHFLTPSNGPAAHLVRSGEVKYSHFLFRLDFADWELMKKAVPEGEELMPNREVTPSPVYTEANKSTEDISMNPVYTEANESKRDISMNPIYTEANESNRDISMNPVYTEANESNRDISMNPVYTEANESKRDISMNPVYTEANESNRDISMNPVYTEANESNRDISMNPVYTEANESNRDISMNPVYTEANESNRDISMNPVYTEANESNRDISMNLVYIEANESKRDISMNPVYTEANESKRYISMNPVYIEANESNRDISMNPVYTEANESKRDISMNPVYTEANESKRDISMNPVFTKAYKVVQVDDSRLKLRFTRVKKLSRNHGSVLRDASDVNNSPEIGDANIGNGGRLKRKLL